MINVTDLGTLLLLLLLLVKCDHMLQLPGEQLPHVACVYYHITGRDFALCVELGAQKTASSTE